MALIDRVKEAQRQRQEIEFTAWIKPDILAEIIFEELESAGHEPTVANAKVVYMDILENALYDAVKSAIKNNPAFSQERSGFAPQPTP